MTKKQPKRPAYINKAMKELRSFARSEMAKTEIVQFRVDQTDFKLLVEAATACKLPMGTLVRGWVLDRLKCQDGFRHKQMSEVPMFVAEKSPDWQANTKTSSQVTPDVNSKDIADLRHELTLLQKRMNKIELGFQQLSSKNIN